MGERPDCPRRRTHLRLPRGAFILTATTLFIQLRQSVTTHSVLFSSKQLQHYAPSRIPSAMSTVGASDNSGHQLHLSSIRLPRLHRSWNLNHRKR